MAYKIKISFTKLIAKALRHMGKVEIDGENACLILMGDSILLSVSRPLYVRINNHNIGKVKSEIYIGYLTTSTIKFIDEYKSGYEKVIELSDEPFKDDQTEGPKTKKTRLSKKVVSLSDI